MKSLTSPSITFRRTSNENQYDCRSRCRFCRGGNGGAFLFNHLRPSLDAPAPQAYAVLDKDKKQVGTYVIPPDRDILKQPNASEIMHGKRLLNETARLLPDNVGNGLNCNSCHMGQGKMDNVASYINTSNFYPAVMPRAGKEVDLVLRINGCFQRSMNGKPLPPDGADMKAMIAYMDWLRQDVKRARKWRSAMPVPSTKALFLTRSKVRKSMRPNVRPVTALPVKA